jgi:hypothetical protein
MYQQPITGRIAVVANSDTARASATATLEPPASSTQASAAVAAVHSGRSFPHSSSLGQLRLVPSVGQQTVLTSAIIAQAAQPIAEEVRTADQLVKSTLKC